MKLTILAITVAIMIILAPQCDEAKRVRKHRVPAASRRSKISDIQGSGRSNDANVDENTYTLFSPNKRRRNNLKSTGTRRNGGRGGHDRSNERSDESAETGRFFKHMAMMKHMYDSNKSDSNIIIITQPTATTAPATTTATRGNNIANAIIRNLRRRQRGRHNGHELDDLLGAVVGDDAYEVDRHGGKTKNGRFREKSNVRRVRPQRPQRKQLNQQIDSLLGTRTMMDKEPSRITGNHQATPPRHREKVMMKELDALSPAQYEEVMDALRKKSTPVSYYH